MATIRELADYYVDRLIVQFRTQQKARDTIAILVKQPLADELPASLNAAFNIDTAVGSQLDTLAKYVGVPRNIGALIAAGYFGLWSYGNVPTPANYQGTWDPATNTPAIPAASGGNAGWWYVASATGTSTAPTARNWIVGDIILSDGVAWGSNSVTTNSNGFTTYADLSSNANGIFYSYDTAGRSVTALTDESFRTILKLQIILNSNDGTLASIMDLLQIFFPGQIALVDNTTMSMDYYVNSTVPLTQALLLGYLPKPMGVGITVTIVSPVPGGTGSLLTEAGATITTEDGFTITTEPT